VLLGLFLTSLSVVFFILLSRIWIAAKPLFIDPNNWKLLGSFSSIRAYLFMALFLETVKVYTPSSL
jgi:hypothetical protein